MARANGICQIIGSGHRFHRSGGIDFNSSLRADLAVINRECVAYSVPPPKTSAGVFKLAQCGLNTFVEQDGYWLVLTGCPVQLGRPRTDRVASPSRFVGSFGIGVDTVRAWSNRGVSSCHQLVGIHLAGGLYRSRVCTWWKLDLIWHWSARASRSEKILSKARLCLKDDLALLGCSHEMSRYDVEWSVHDYLRPLLTACPNILWPFTLFAQAR